MINEAAENYESSSISIIQISLDCVLSKTFNAYTLNENS